MTQRNSLSISKHLVRRVTDIAYERYLGDILGINATTEQKENSP